MTTGLFDSVEDAVECIRANERQNGIKFVCRSTSPGFGSGGNNNVTCLAIHVHVLVVTYGASVKSVQRKT